jgi:hypothetical protein
MITFIILFLAVVLGVPVGLLLYNFLYGVRLQRKWRKVMAAQPVTASRFGIFTGGMAPIVLAMLAAVAIAVVKRVRR